MYAACILVVITTQFNGGTPMFRALTASLAFLISSVMAGYAFAGNPFEISGVRMDAYGSNVTVAREQAIRAGTLDATYQLMDRLTLPSDRLALDPPLVITEDVAEQLVAGIQIARERRSSSRYLGELSVSFDAQAVRSFLRLHGLPFVESQALPVLVVVLWQNDDGKTVIGTENPFARVMSDPAFQNHLVPMKLATQGMDVEESAGSERVWKLANMDPALLNELAMQTNVDEIIVTSAKKTGPNSVSIRARRAKIGADGVESLIAMGRFSGVAPFDTRPREVLSYALRDAAKKIALVLETEWKHTAIVREDLRQSVRLTALYDNLSQWQRLRDALGGVALVEEARLDALSYDGALLTLRYIGSEEQLARRLAQKGVELRNEDIGLVARIH